MANSPCPKCNSSDAVEHYPDGDYCFSCGYKFFPDAKESPIITTELTKQHIRYRGHSLEALAKYGVYTLVSPDGTPKEVVYPYKSFNKHRKLDEKVFYGEGADTKASELFGAAAFSAGSASAITVTEGEEDCLSVYEMFGSKYPVVSVRSASTAHKDCSVNFEYLNSFEKIYLSFDNDAPGQKAAAQVATLFPFNKVYLVKLSKFKDANEAHQAGAEDEYKRVWYNAKRFVPENIVSSSADFAEILEEKEKESLATYPFTKLQTMLRGIRPGETVLFKAQEGIGKTEVMGAIEHHVLKTTDLNIGVIHLEEPIRRSLQRFAGYELGRPVHLDTTTSKEEILATVQHVTKRDNRVHFYKNFNSEDLNGVLNSIRFLVSSCECRIVFLDHISRLVSGTMEPDERKALDFISTRLSQLAEELQFGLVMVTHVNDDGKTRGSRNISKEAYAVINLDRDIVAEDEGIRNTTFMTIEKNRWGSLTGPAGCLYFDSSSFTLSETEPPKLAPLE